METGQESGHEGGLCLLHASHPHPSFGGDFSSTGSKRSQSYGRNADPTNISGKKVESRPGVTEVGTNVMDVTKRKLLPCSILREQRISGTLFPQLRSLCPAISLL